MNMTDSFMQGIAEQSNAESVPTALGTHGVLVSVWSSVLKALVSAAGVYLASKGVSIEQTATGLVITISSMLSLGASLNSSNNATKVAASAGLLKV